MIYMKFHIESVVNQDELQKARTNMNLVQFTNLIHFEAGTKMNYVIIQNCNNASCIGMKNGYELSHEYMLSGNNHTVHNCTCM